MLTGSGEGCACKFLTTETNKISDGFNKERQKKIREEKKGR
jgi:hypothetical protein